MTANRSMESGRCLHEQVGLVLLSMEISKVIIVTEIGQYSPQNSNLQPTGLR